MCVYIYIFFKLHVSSAGEAAGKIWGVLTKLPLQYAVDHLLYKTGPPVLSLGEGEELLALLFPTKLACQYHQWVKWKRLAHQCDYYWVMGEECATLLFTKKTGLAYHHWVKGRRPSHLFSTRLACQYHHYWVKGNLLYKTGLLVSSLVEGEEELHHPLVPSQDCAW